MEIVDVIRGAFPKGSTVVTFLVKPEGYPVARFMGDMIINGTFQVVPLDDILVEFGDTEDVAYVSCKSPPRGVMIDSPHAVPLQEAVQRLGEIIHNDVNAFRWHDVTETREYLLRLTEQQVPEQTSIEAGILPLLRQVVEIVRTHAYMPEYRAGASTEACLGMAVSKFLEWDSGAILKATAYALGDANYQKEADLMDTLARQEDSDMAESLLACAETFEKKQKAFNANLIDLDE